MIGILALLLLLGSGAGCGGSGNGAGDLSAPSSAVSPQNAALFSTDALALAARVTPAPWLPVDVVAEIDADLTRIREQYPATRDVHTPGGYDLTHIAVRLRADAPWRDKWQQGEAARTGEPALDALLAEYNVVRARLLFPSIESDNDWFLLEFVQPVNVLHLEEPFRRSSPFITDAHRSAIGGAGDWITFEWLPNGGRKYILMKYPRPGDESGRRFWEFHITPPAGDLILVREYVDDLSQPAPDL